jgi:hypothetical protein
MSPDIHENDSGGDDRSGRDDARLDATLRGFLCAELDGQLGRARAAFEARATPSTRSTHGAAQRQRRFSRSRVWVIGVAGAGTAMAASLAAVWAVPLLGRMSSHTTATTTSIVTPLLPSPHAESPGVTADTTAAGATGDADWQPVQQVTSSATLYQGVLLVGGKAPARVVRNLSTERTEWFDPDRNIRMETTVPRENVMLINVDTY